MNKKWHGARARMIACRCWRQLVHFCARGAKKKCATLCIPDNRYLVFIELVARVRISCGVRTACPFYHHFFHSPHPPSPAPPLPECRDFFYGLLAFVYLKFHNVLRDNIERTHIPYFFTIKDRKKSFSSVVVLWNLFLIFPGFSWNIKRIFLS